jgi:hypothetical protein
MIRSQKRKPSKRGFYSKPKMKVKAKRKAQPVSRKARPMLKTKTFIRGKKRIARKTSKTVKKVVARKTVSFKSQFTRINKSIKELQNKKSAVDKMIKRYKGKSPDGNAMMKMAKSLHQKINIHNAAMKKCFSGLNREKMAKFVKTKKFMNQKKKISSFQRKLKNCSARMHTWRKHQFKMYTHILREMDKYGAKFDRAFNQCQVLGKNVARSGFEMPEFCKLQRALHQCQLWDASFQVKF